MVRKVGVWVADEKTGRVGRTVGRVRTLMVIEGTSHCSYGRPLVVQWLANPLSLRRATDTEKSRGVLPVGV